jgi:integral membrane protein (TIGR01906 family)
MWGDEARGWTWLGTVSRVLFYVAFPLALVTTNVRFAFSEQRVYQYSIDHYDAPATTGVSRPDLIAATKDIRAYFDNDEVLLRTKVHDASGNVVPLFNTREVLHMRDVKTLVQRLYALETLAICVVLGFVVARHIWSGEDSLHALAARLVQASVATVALVLAFGVAAATGFDTLFTRFHELSFGNDFWQLDPARDHLVQMFPQGFWLDATLLIAGLTVLEAAVIGGAAWLYLRRGDREMRPEQARTAENSDRPGEIPSPVV